MTAITAGDLRQAIDRMAPFDTAESWDNSGLLIGDYDQPVEAVLVALDVTDRVIDEAVERRADLIVTHHPVIFTPLKRIPRSSLVYRLIREGLAVISAHTNLDLCEGGVNDCLAARLGLTGVSTCAQRRGLLGQPSGPEDAIGRFGSLEEELDPMAFADYVKERLGCDGVRLVPGNRPVRRVAVLGGAGSSLLQTAHETGADALVTADTKHNVQLDAARLGLTLVDAGHFPTEQVVIGPLSGYLSREFPMLQVMQSRQSGDCTLYR